MTVANYTFSCQHCGEFTEWHRSTRGNKETSQCPACNETATRVFMPPITFRMNAALKHTIAKGMEPTLTNKEDLPNVPIKHAVRKKRPQLRPWQAGS